MTSAGTTFGLVDDQDRLLDWGAASFSYDADGDLTTWTDSTGVTGEVIQTAVGWVALGRPRKNRQG